MANKFVLLEITDSEISGFINEIRRTLNEEKLTSSVHLTIRGPYEEKDKISSTEVEEWERLLRESPILIEGCDRFMNGDKEIVYLKVHQKNLEKIWWKPQFPTERYGFNPHITIYEGDDRLFATLVCNFIRGERISLVCKNFRLITYALRQNDLFDIPDIAYRPPLNLINNKLISVTFLERLNRLTYNYRQAKKKNN